MLSDADILKMINSIIDSFELGTERTIGWVHNPWDDGGPTQWGIASNYQPDLATKIRAKQLTRPEAEAWYLQQFKNWKFHLLPAPVAFMAFDHAVHGSLAAFVSALQIYLREICNRKVDLDGKWGSQTRNALLTLPPNAIPPLIVTEGVRGMTDSLRLAKHEMEDQKRNGAPVRDLSKGFFSRARWRYVQAATWLRSYQA